MFPDDEHGVYMKKVLIKILVSLLAVSLLCTGLLACKKSTDWKGTHSGWGEGNITGSFIGQKGDYVYFINGIADSTADNTFGTPVKGSLMAAKKTDLTKAHVVIPKLFAATDYGAGLYVYGDYVYYASPSTDKTSSGTIANAELAFHRTKLDGTGTETFFKLSTLSSEYRILEIGGKVYIVYYDVADFALKCYNTSSKQVSQIAKTDDTVKGVNAKSLKNYFFAKDVSGGVAVYYTTTVYAENYFEDKAATEDYVRAEQDYNVVYSYTPGDKIADGDNVAGKVILDEAKTVYDIKLIKEDKVFYTATKDSKSTTYELKSGTEIINTSAIDGGNVFVEESDGLWAYALDKDSKVITKAPLCNENDKINLETEAITIADEASALLAKQGAYLYYTSETNQLMRVDVETGEEKPQRVSDGSVANLWYAPVFMNVGGVDYVFYSDTSSTGATYVHYVDLNGTIKEEDTDDDGEADKFYLEGHKLLGAMTEADRPSVFTALIANVTGELDSGVLPYEIKEDGATLYVPTLDEAQTIYDSLSENAKKSISAETLNTFNNYKEAVKMANVLRPLDGIVSYDVCDQAKKTAYKTAYNSMKSQVEAFKSSATFTAVSGLLQKNMLWNYQKATSLFETSK